MSPSTRARPLSGDERRASIIDAVIPLLLEHGSTVTSRQISEAAGVAEGTIFRAFGDKDSLVSAAVEEFMTRRNAVPDGPIVDLSLPLERKIAVIVGTMRIRVRDVVRMATVTGQHGPHPTEEQRAAFVARIAEALELHVDELAISPERLADYLRALAIATTVPLGGESFDDDELVPLIMHGIVHPPTTARKD